MHTSTKQYSNYKQLNLLYQFQRTPDYDTMGEKLH